MKIKFNARAFFGAITPLILILLFGMAFGMQYAVITMQVAFMERTSIAMSINALRPMLESVRNGALVSGTGMGATGGFYLGHLFGRRKRKDEDSNDFRKAA